MPSHSRALGGDPAAAGRARQRLKIGAIGYFNTRHGVDADLAQATTARKALRRLAVEYAEAVTGPQLKYRRADLLDQGDDGMLQFAAIAYSAARHGIDADVGMAREGLAFLCQSAIGFSESLPEENAAKRKADARLQIGNGARP